VVKDAFSDSNHRPALADGLGRESDGELLRSPLGNLTQELAQLLAASIAQNQVSKGPRAGAPTNAELTSLADLVSAAVAQRTIAPAFKDGLSTLSHTRPRPFFAPQPMVPPPLDLGHDDEPMPIPSTWRQPFPHEDDRWFRQQMGAAVLGLIAGLMIVVPAVLWLSGFFSPQKSGPNAAWVAPSAADARAAPEAKVADVKTVRVPVRPMDLVRPVEKSPESAAQFVMANVEQPRPAPVEAKPPPQVPVIATARLIDPNKARIDALLAEAAQRIDSGDITGAREMLADADDGGQGAVSFALAETYDPNMLAAWGTRGVAADAAKARTLYHKAFDLGVARAQKRLDALR
jgi:hypothetical protein